MALKKRKNTKKKVKTAFKKNMFIFISVLLLIALVAFGYYLGQESEYRPIEQKDNEIRVNAKNIEDFKDSNISLTPKKTEVKNESIKIIKEKVETKKKYIKKEEITKVTNNTKLSKEKEHILLVDKEKRSKLVIIIDDIHTQEQLKMIQELKMKITPSIFPPYSLSEDSNLLAKDLVHYVIHLPMESSNKKFNSQTKTLMSSDSDEQILNRVVELRKLFPKGRYVNSHTGSVFTSKYDVMKKLYKALKDKGFVFIDSFTKASSKVEQIANEYDDDYVRRDIFIDNEQNIISIHGQLRKAVEISKKKGHAIVIGHPHKITMEALQTASKIFKDVDLVYIDDLYKKK